MTKIISVRRKKKYSSDLSEGKESILPPLRATGRFSTPGVLQSLLGVVLIALFMTALAQSVVHANSNHGAVVAQISMFERISWLR